MFLPTKGKAMADNESATTEQQAQPTGGTTVNVTVQYPGGQKPVKKVK